MAKVSPYICSLRLAILAKRVVKLIAKRDTFETTALTCPAWVFNDLPQITEGMSRTDVVNIFQVDGCKAHQHVRNLQTEKALPPILPTSEHAQGVVHRPS